MFRSLFAGLLPAARRRAAGPARHRHRKRPAVHGDHFEGVGHLAAIPVFGGISSPGWQGLFDQDAGGTGNFAQEPSPQTSPSAGRHPGSRDIVVTSKASKVAFYCASFASATMRAGRGRQCAATSTGGPNYRGDRGDPNGDFNKWDPLSVEADGNKITTVRVTGNTNQTGIDNLKVCSTIGVEAVETTQAIRQYQDLAALKASLGAGREPPVPVVADKTGVLRVYMREVDAVTTVSLRLTGQITENRAVTLAPQRQPEDQRRERNGCRAVNFHFIPPEGNWDVNIKVLASGGNVLEDHDLLFKSRKTDTLTLKAVTVCDARNAAGVWQCVAAGALAGKTTLLRKIAPTSAVGLEITNCVVRRDASLYADSFGWWERRPRMHTIYTVSSTGWGVETVEVVGHEVGHTLGLRRANTGAPAAGAAPPGCCNAAADSGTDWPSPTTASRARRGSNWASTRAMRGRCCRRALSTSRAIACRAGYRRCATSAP